MGLLENIAKSGKFPTVEVELKRSTVVEFAVGILISGSILILLWFVASAFAKKL